MANKFLHTMIRVNNLDESIEFYTEILGLKLLRQTEYPKGSFTLAFLGYVEEEDAPMIELTYNWGTHVYDMGTAYGHIAIGVEDIFKICEEMRAKGVKITREPAEMKFGGGTVLAFIEDPNGYKIELIQNKK